MPMDKEELRAFRVANLAKARETNKGKPRVRKAAPAPVVLTDTPEFKAAVAEAARAATAEILSHIATEGKSSSESADDMKWARTLALAIGEISDQGTDRKRVAPEILASRDASAKRMRDLIIEARNQHEMPVYQLRNKVQLPLGALGEAIIEPVWLGNDKIHYPTEIDWPGVPNLSMIPINDAAKRIFDAFAGSVANKIEHDLDANLAVTPGGAVVRGGAATALFRATGGRAELSRPGIGAQEDIGAIRRHQPAQTKEVRVLGTIQPPARENA